MARPLYSLYAGRSTDELLALWSSLMEYPCDNDAPGTCCNYCNRAEIAEILTARLSVEVTV